MAVNYRQHPRGLAPPPHWAGLSNIPAEEFNAWWASTQAQAPARGGKGNSKKGYRADLGHSCRSSMEANLERYLRYLGYEPWLEKHPAEPPLEAGRKFYRYEGRRFDFPFKTANGKYISDFEVWPGVVDRSRPYELLEVKGWMDPDSKTKLNRMGKFFPEIPLEVLTPEEFKQLTRGARNLIPHWE